MPTNTMYGVGNSFPRMSDPDRIDKINRYVLDQLQARYAWGTLITTDMILGILAEIGIQDVEEGFDKVRQEYVFKIFLNDGKKFLTWTNAYGFW